MRKNGQYARYDRPGQCDGMRCVIGDLVSYQNNRECSTTIAGKARIAPVSIPPRAWISRSLARRAAHRAPYLNPLRTGRRGHHQGQ